MDTPDNIGGEILRLFITVNRGGYFLYVPVLLMSHISGEFGDCKNSGFRYKGIP